MIDDPVWYLALAGSVAFVFSLRAEAEGWFLFYTFLFAFCAASVVVLI